VNKSQTEATESVVPRKAVATPAQVLKALELTPEEMADIRKEQDLMLYRSRALLTPAERRRGLGIELEQHHLKTGNKDGLAEALALQGKYKEAATTAVNKLLRREYAEKARAVTKPDSDCPCDSFQEIGEYNLPTQYIEFYGHSDKHGVDMPFIRCTLCGELNAMPAPQHLLEQRDLRNSDTDERTRQNFFKK
jgi:hypothetical protein